MAVISYNFFDVIVVGYHHLIWILMKNFFGAEPYLLWLQIHLYQLENVKI
jgi:hypothetical protein